MRVLLVESAGTCENDSDLSFQELPAEIREYMLKMLSTQDLLNCRLVNHQWKTEANSVLKSRKVYAVLKRPCKDLIRLDLHLTKYNFEVINGLKLFRGVGCCIGSNHTGEGRSVDSYLSDQLATAVPWKFIFIGGLWFFDRCPAREMVDKILLKVGGSLEEVLLESAPAFNIFYDFVLSVADENRVLFPKLRKLSMLPRQTITTDPEFSSLLLSAAPNLNQIDCTDAYEWDWEVNNFEDVAKRISISSIDYSDSYSLENLQRFLQYEPKSVKILQIGCVCDEKDHQDMIIRLMRLNRNSLKELTFCAYELAEMLETLGLDSSVFPKVQKLTVELRDSGLNKRLVERINLSRSFPAVTEVHVRGYCELEDDDAGDSEEEDQVLDSRFLPSHAQILNYYGCFKHHQPRTCRLLGQVFALVTKMHVNWSLGSFGLSEIFAVFPRLESLNLWFEGSSTPSPGSVDAALCGLNPEEAELLQDLSKDASLPLEELALAPVRPALSYSKRLKRLQIDTKNFSVDAVRLVSEVSGVLAFSRLPELKVQICTNFAHVEDVRRVRPYIAEAEVDGLDKVV